MAESVAECKQGLNYIEIISTQMLNFGRNNPTIDKHNAKVFKIIGITVMSIGLYKL